MPEARPRQPVLMFAVSDVGCVREKNEDSVHIDPERGLAVLADGMGGHRAGDVASRLAVETIINQLQQAAHGHDPQQLLQTALTEANRAVYQASRENAEQFGMGTTAVAVLVEQDRAHIAHVGDSRAYLLRDAKLLQKTEDHSYLARIEHLGLEAQDLIQDSAMAKMLVRAIGIEAEVSIDRCEIATEPGDCLLLCSDGLTDMLCDDEILEILTASDISDATAASLVHSANRKGGPDNISVILICV